MYNIKLLTFFSTIRRLGASGKRKKTSLEAPHVMPLTGSKNRNGPKLILEALLFKSLSIATVHHLGLFYCHNFKDSSVVELRPSACLSKIFQASRLLRLKNYKVVSQD